MVTISLALEVNKPVESFEEFGRKYQVANHEMISRSHNDQVSGLNGLVQKSRLQF